jgi:DNA-binding beta-propeller fold protein YncE
MHHIQSKLNSDWLNKGEIMNNYFILSLFGWCCINIYASFVMAFDTHENNKIMGIINNPFDMAITADGSKGYISSQVNACLLIADLKADRPTIYSQINIPGNIDTKPTAIAYNEHANELYIIDVGNHCVFVVNTITDDIYPQPINVSPFPQNIIYNHKKVYVCSTSKDEISIVNTESRSFEKNISLSEDADPHGMAIVLKKLYVVGKWSKKLYIISLDNSSENYHKIVKTIPLKEKPYDAIASPDETSIYISHNSAEGLISVINTTTDTLQTEISLSDEGDTDYKNPKGMTIVKNVLYVVNSGNRTISGIDIESQKRLKAPLFISADSYPENIVSSPDAETLYIIHPLSDSVRFIPVPEYCPDFVPGPNIFISNSDGIKTFPSWAKSMENVNNTSMKFYTSALNPEIFTILPQISSTGALTFSPKSGITGSSIVNVRLKDESIMDGSRCNESVQKSFTIHVSVDQFLLSISKTGRGEILINDSKSVLPNPSWQASFNKGKEIRLMAMPLKGWRFLYWSKQEEVITTNPVLLTMDRNIGLIAHFTDAESTVTESFVFKFTKGWNRFSLPLIVDEMEANKLFSAAEIIYEFKDGGFVEAQKLKPGVGYWIKLDSDQQIFINGVPFQEYAILLNPGWHLLGGIIDKVKPITVPDNAIEVIYDYHDGGDFPVVEFRPGSGCWIKVIRSCELILSLHHGK